MFPNPLAKGDSLYPRWDEDSLKYLSHKLVFEE